MRRVEFRPRARRDLAEAKAWYASQQPGLDRKLRSHLRTLLARIAEFPRLYSRAPFGTARRAPVVGPFPYSVYYRERGDRVEILAILPNASDPEEWRQRSS